MASSNTNPTAVLTDKKPKLSFWQIWNMSFGFLGIQMGFALQNANASRILQTFGADVEHLSWFWLVAPLTGMIVQPIIGHMSDNTWTRLGRRRPFFLAGAVLAAIGLMLMPNADLFTSVVPVLWVGAGFLMIMDASFNIAMEPFRALVGDKLSTEQRTDGFSIQTVLIGIGAVIGSWMPYVLVNWFGYNDTAPAGEVPDSLVLSFVAGAVVLLGSIIWTVIRTKEYTPKEQAEYNNEVFIEDQKSSFSDIIVAVKQMPKPMIQLGLVQFFSWFGLFSMWVFSTPAIAHHVYNLPLNETSSATYNEAANWVGILFGIYNGVSAIYAFFIPRVAKRFGRKKTHASSLIIGGLSLISIFIISDPMLLILPMIGIGIAWASILAMPYAILAGSLPHAKMGIYMGIFNFFITLPQVTNGIIGGMMVKYLFGGNPIYSLVFGGVCFLIAAATVTRVDDKDDLVLA
jgi:maltose/moltooligosaccharide transporter